MKKLLVSVLGALLLWSCAEPFQRYVPEGQTALVKWEFSKDGKSWEKVIVPHSYNAIDGRSESYYRGKAFYRTNVSVSNPSQPAYLVFEGAAQTARVFVNGEEACYHRGGYTAFTVDISAKVKRAPMRFWLNVTIPKTWSSFRSVPTSTRTAASTTRFGCIYLQKMLILIRRHSALTGCM